MLIILLLLRLTAITCHCFSVVVLAYQRPQLLRKLLDDLRAVVIPSNWTSIPLQIYIDQSPNGPDKKVVALAQSFNWGHGKKTVTIRTAHYGLQHQWLHAFPDATPDCCVLILEDDLRLSPLIFIVVDILLKKKVEDRIFGIALQRPQWVIGRSETGRFRRLDRLKEVPAAFLYPSPATWGFLACGLNWAHFVQWSRSFLSLKTHQYALNAITTKWAEERGAMNLISPLMLEFMRHNKLTILWTFFSESTLVNSSDLRYLNDTLVTDTKSLNQLHASLNIVIREYDHCFHMATRKVVIPSDLQCAFKAGEYPNNSQGVLTNHI